jgi:hypothetical protein
MSAVLFELIDTISCADGLIEALVEFWLAA